MKKNHKIRYLLTKYPETRDDDGLLAYKYFQEYYSGTLEEFVLSNLHVSINSMRRFVQQYHPEYRGNTYLLRQEKSHKIKNDINIFKKHRQQERPEELLKQYGHIIPEKSVLEKVTLFFKKIIGEK